MNILTIYICLFYSASFRKIRFYQLFICDELDCSADNKSLIISWGSVPYCRTYSTLTTWSCPMFVCPVSSHHWSLYSIYKGDISTTLLKIWPSFVVPCVNFLFTCMFSNRNLIFLAVKVYTFHQLLIKGLELEIFW